METQEELNIGIGTLEIEKVSLKPAKVKIVSVRIEDTSKARKVVFESKHPNKEETINISSVAYIVDRNVKVSGTWFSLDKEGKLQKGTALATFLNRIGASTINEAVGKEVDTDMDGNYLCFKAY